MKTTGYWTFFCNPRIWEIDKFLKLGIEDSIYKVTKSHREYFEEGQMGIIRVGKDNRTKKELGEREKLKRGIYSIVKIHSTANFITDDNDPFWLDEEQRGKKEWRVHIKYLANHLDNPILLDDLKEMEEFEDEKVLINGMPTTTWPLGEKAFNKILEISDLNLEKNNQARKEYIFNVDDIERLIKKYENATPRIKEVISRKIERGQISNAIKKYYDYECMICKAKDLNPLGFQKANGEYYIETHHFFPVSKLKKGSLGWTNLMTLCANHHRQIHYGNIEIISSNDDFFELKIDNEYLKITKKKIR